MVFCERSRELCPWGSLQGTVEVGGQWERELVWDESTGGRSQEVALKGTSVPSKNRKWWGREPDGNCLSTAGAEAALLCSVALGMRGWRVGRIRGCLRKPD